jgi:hypothetical protein
MSQQKNLKIKLYIYIIIFLFFIFYFIFFYFLFFGSGSLDPAYVCGVKRAGDREKYCSSKYNALGQVHELLIWYLSASS